MFYCRRRFDLHGPLRAAGHDGDPRPSGGSLGSGHRLAGALALEKGHDADGVDSARSLLMLPAMLGRAIVAVIDDLRGWHSTISVVCNIGFTRKSDKCGRSTRNL